MKALSAREMAMGAAISSAVVAAYPYVKKGVVDITTDTVKLTKGAWKKVSNLFKSKKPGDVQNINKQNKHNQNRKRA